MTLELARKRRDQSDLIHELVDALVKQGRIDYTEGARRWHLEKCRRRGSLHPLGWADCSEDCQEARAVIAKAYEHDCIPWDDAK